MLGYGQITGIAAVHDGNILCFVRSVQRHAGLRFGNSIDIAVHRNAAVIQDGMISAIQFIHPVGAKVQVGKERLRGDFAGQSHVSYSSRRICRIRRRSKQPELDRLAAQFTGISAVHLHRLGDGDIALRRCDGGIGNGDHADAAGGVIRRVVGVAIPHGHCAGIGGSRLFHHIVVDAVACLVEQGQVIPSQRTPRSCDCGFRGGGCAVGQVGSRNDLRPRGQILRLDHGEGGTVAAHRGVRKRLRRTAKLRVRSAAIRNPQEVGGQGSSEGILNAILA